MEKIAATEESLEIAEGVARALDIAFDKEITRTDTLALIEHYYMDIRQVLHNETEGFVFENFLAKEIAFADYAANNQPLIFFGEQFHTFLFGLNILLCMKTFCLLGEFDENVIIDLFSDSLHTLSEPERDIAVREALKPYLLKHVETLPVANAVTFCMIAFIICHEIAHHCLNHLHLDESSEQELEADGLAYSFLIKISDHAGSMPSLNIGKNMLCAPIISMHFLDFIEKKGLVNIAPGVHPSAEQRAYLLEKFFNSVATQEANNLYEGLCAGLNDFREILLIE